jgi:hypothetical protein
MALEILLKSNENRARCSDFATQAHPNGSSMAARAFRACGWGHSGQ